MKTNIIFLVILLISGCATETETETEEEYVSESEETESDLAPRVTPDESESSDCDFYGSVEGVIDGKRVPIPVDCNPFYFDKGDPLPEMQIPHKELILDT